MTSNFEFLQKDYPLLYNIASLAEQYLYSDANTCMFKLRQFGEVVVNEVFEIERIPLPAENNQANRINILKCQDVPSLIIDFLHQLRIKGNYAVHSSYDSTQSAETLLSMAHKVGRWFGVCYGSGSGKHIEFVLPEKNTLNNSDFQGEKQEQEAKIQELTKKLEELQTQKEYWQEAESKEFISAKKSRKEKSDAYVNGLFLSEKETRKIIDNQLNNAGWEADSINLTYKKGTRPEKGKNKAIAEFPTEKGFADYALFAGLKLVGIIEAKPEHKDISSILAVQCKDYATSIKSEHSEYLIGEWGAYKVPFIFATNGRKYLRQLETKSGIWFLDTRRNDNIPKALQSWKSPQGLLEDLEKDIEKANQKLSNTSYDLLRDKDGLNLREYQIKAVEKTEEALLKGKQNILLSMATGTGKTRTMLGMIYRFLESKRFKRILFLVDRTTLGSQAYDVFNEVKITDLQTLSNIYNIKSLEDKNIERETKIHLSTVQAMVKRIAYNEGEIPSVSDYDLVIIDEAHRGYTLDRELDDDELEFRNQDDFVSKYRMVIDYFDAVKIAVTATPALHTTEIFGRPIFEYSYREAVLDGYLVDYELPHQIVSKFRQDSIHYEKGETIQVLDPENKEVTDYSIMEDELNFDVEQFNKRIIVEDFNRVILNEIAKNIDPEGKGKTLIFAVDDAHADLIVKILKEIYSEQGVDNDAVMKITGSIGDKKRVQEAVNRFKNETFPSVVVTVDLLTTGIDVPEINTLVFMRRVKSRILFEQMMGRATRLCPKIGKDYFEVYDPVGVFESISDFTDMKPLVVNASASTEDLFNGLQNTDNEDSIKKYTQQILARIQRKLKNIRKEDEAYFANITEGISVQDFATELKNKPLNEMKNFVSENKKAIEFLLNIKNKSQNIKFISDKKDEILSVHRGFGEKEQRPEDYIEAFSAFIKENQNKITALGILCTRPKELTRHELKSLRLEMEQQGYSIKQINQAWNKAKNVEITTDIIGIVRTLALGNSLIDYKIRLENAFKKLKENRDFTTIEKKWLERIEKHLYKEQFIDTEDFNTGAFKNEGGYEKINKVFKNQLDNIVDELKEYLFVG